MKVYTPFSVLCIEILIMAMDIKLSFNEHNFITNISVISFFFRQNKESKNTNLCIHNTEYFRIKLNHNNITNFKYITKKDHICDGW